MGIKELQNKGFGSHGGQRYYSIKKESTRF